MPIRPENRHRYPPDWPQISRRIRIERSGGQCECEGECRISPGHLGRRCPARNGKRHPATGSIVVLTVAHLDQTPEHCQDANLKAMCQRCHLAYDQNQHTANAARTLFLRRTAGMTPIFDLPPDLEAVPLSNTAERREP